MLSIDPLDQSYTASSPPTVGTFVSTKCGSHGIVVSTPFGQFNNSVYVRVTWLGIGSEGITDNVTTDARITDLEMSTAGEVYWIANRDS